MGLITSIVQNHLLTQRAKYMPLRTLGKTGLKVTAFGLGGQSLLEIKGHQKDACNLINKALDLGVNYFDTATIYGPSRKYLGQSLGPRRTQVVLASKVMKKTYNGAKEELDESLDLLKTDMIDIVQLHSIENENDKIRLQKGGALQLLVEAQKAGKIRFIGLTGHYDPNILIEFMNEFDFDTLLVALNPAVPQFMKAVEKAREKAMGVISMKVMSRGVLPLAFPADKLLQWSMRRSDVSIVGCSNETDLEQNVVAAAEYSNLVRPDFELTPEFRRESSFFAKGFDSQPWPTTYQPNWPELLFDNN